MRAKRRGWGEAIASCITNACVYPRMAPEARTGGAAIKQRAQVDAATRCEKKALPLRPDACCHGWRDGCDCGQPGRREGAEYPWQCSPPAGGDEGRLAAGDAVLDNDYVSTSTNSFADLALSETRILLGPQTELLIDSFLAAEGGTLELGLGRMVFDRPDNLPKMDVAVRTAFGMIGVRGTKFFCGPSRAAFAVFVERGSVSVRGGGVTRTVSAGQGVDFTSPGAPPSEPTNWGQARIRQAYASVGLR